MCEIPVTFTSLFTWESLIRSNGDTPTSDQQANYHKALKASLNMFEGFTEKHGRNFEKDLMIDYALDNYPDLARRN